MSTVSINWGTKVIYIPKDFMTLIQASPEIRQLDMNTFRLKLKDLEDDESGMPFEKTHSHNTEVVLSGDTYARVVEILAPYTVTFEDGQYSVKCVGANHNLVDVKNPNQVSLIIGNSAGLVKVKETDYSDYADALLNELLSEHTVVGTLGKVINDTNINVLLDLKINSGRWKILNNQMILYDSNGGTPLYTFNLLDKNGQLSMTEVYERVPV